MKNPLKNLLLGSAKETVEAVANVVDRFVSTPEEKEAVRQSIEEEITKRWQADSLTDSWLSKNVRPLVLVWWIVVFSIAGILDSIESIPFHIGATWNDTFEKGMMSVG